MLSPVSHSGSFSSTRSPIGSFSPAAASSLHKGGSMGGGVGGGGSNSTTSTINSPMMMSDSPFLKMQTISNDLSNMNTTAVRTKKSIIVQYQKVLQYYAVTLITELEKVHQLLRDNITYLMKSGEWETSYCVLQELRIHYNNIVLPSFESGNSKSNSSTDSSGGGSSALFATPAMKHIKNAWKIRKDAMLSEIDHSLDKIKDRLRHDEFHRPLPIVYAVRFLCSPWEDEDEEVEIAVPPPPSSAASKGRAANKTAAPTKKKRNSILFHKTSTFLDLTAFYEATNFEVIVIDSEGKHVKTGEGGNKGTANGTGGEGGGDDDDEEENMGLSSTGLLDADSLHQAVHELQNSQQRRRSRETWLLLKYDILSHVYTSKVYEQIIILQQELNESFKAKQMNAVNNLFGAGKSISGGGTASFSSSSGNSSIDQATDNRLPIHLPENTYFHLVEELRKAYPQFKIHSPQFLVEDRYGIPCKVMQIFQAYPVLPNYLYKQQYQVAQEIRIAEVSNNSSTGIGGVDATGMEYSNRIDDCIKKLGCKIISKSVPNLGGDHSDGDDDDDEHHMFGGDDDDCDISHKHQMSLTASSTQRLTRQATMANIGASSSKAIAGSVKSTINCKGNTNIGTTGGIGEASGGLNTAINSGNGDDGKDPLELDVGAWEMLSHCTDYYVYTFSDPSLRSNAKGSTAKDMIAPVSRIKLSTKCIKYTETVEEQQRKLFAENQTKNMNLKGYPPSQSVTGTGGNKSSDSHNKILARMNYWFAPSAAASVEETRMISIPTAYVEVLAYMRLLVLHTNLFLDHAKSMGINEIIGEPLHDITSSRTLLSAAISHLANIVGTPAIGAIGLHNASTTVRYCIDFKKNAIYDYYFPHLKKVFC